MSGIQRRLRRAVAAAVLLAALSATASAAPRVALVIGNAAYEHTTPLHNSRNDAADVARALRGVGFEVIEGLDLDKSGFEEKLYEFAVAAQGAEASLFFYAGHGLQVDGENYLIPTDARLMHEIDLRLRTFDLTAFTDQMRSATNLVFLDACRDNPLARSLARSMGATRSAAVGRGLGRVDSTSGTLIAYATQPGNVADDGAGRNSPFTEALLAHLATPGQSVNDLMTAVTGAVTSATGGRQQPWVHSSLPHTFHFVPDAAPGSETETAADSEDTAFHRLRAERLAADRAFWASIEASEDPEDYEAYLKQFAEGTYAMLARNRLKQLWVAVPGVAFGEHVGRKVHLSLDTTSRRRAGAATWKAFHTASFPESIAWENLANEGGPAHGFVTITRQGYDGQGRTCREFKHVIIVGDGQEEFYGTACRDGNGDWKIIST